MATHEVQVEECPDLVPTENDPVHVVEDFNLVPSSWQIVITLFLKHTSEHLPIVMMLPSFCSQSRSKELGPGVGSKQTKMSLDSTASRFAPGDPTRQRWLGLIDLFECRSAPQPTLYGWDPAQQTR